jgi:hypothetical protein
VLIFIQDFARIYSKCEILQVLLKVVTSNSFTEMKRVIAAGIFLLATVNAGCQISKPGVLECVESCPNLRLERDLSSEIFKLRLHERCALEISELNQFLPGLLVS